MKVSNIVLLIMEADRQHRKYLIIQTASLGDVVLATSLAESLHTADPGAVIDFLVKKECEGILSGHPYLRKILLWDKKQHKYKNLFALLKIIRKERYDRVVNVHRFASSGLLSAFSKAKVKVGFSKNPWSFCFTKRYPHQISREGKMHEIQRNHQLIKDIVPTEPCLPRMYPRSEDFDSVKKYKSSSYITIAPMSLWFTKQFPIAQWNAFIKGLDDNLIVYLLGSRSDREVLNTMVNESGKTNCVNLASQLSLLQTAALMCDAKMNFTNDSAPLHIASAMNAPLTAIFCSTVPAFGFGPLGARAQVIETREVLQCRPCGIHGLNACPENNMACATTITNQQLKDSIRND